MTDIKTKLDRLKKERTSKPKSTQTSRKIDATPDVEAVFGSGSLKKGRSVETVWQEINRTEGLSTKEKLEQLINLKKEIRPKTVKKPVRDTGGPRESFQVYDNPYAADAKYGKIRISSGLDITGELLTCMSKDSQFRDLDLSSALFLDLETTGLSGGTGVIPFLVGLGYYEEDQFHVVQYFLGEPGEEGTMLSDLNDFFREKDFQSVVSYNGKVFDLPLLETRFIINRLPFILNDLPHLDFLFPARRLWSHKYENCKLSNLALDVVRTGRTEDIPSAEIPWRYFQFIQSGDFSLVEPIIYHNAEDILSLLGVIIVGASIFSDDPDTCSADGMDYFGAGKIMESFGDTEKSLQFFQKALKNGTSEDVTLSVRRRLSLNYKKNEDWDKALDVWREMTDTQIVTRDALFSFRELAMYYEHKEKKYEEARRIAEEGLVASFHVSPYYENDFRHRMERLRLKIKKSKEGESEDK
ncbi:ribonuclease H-like domain-containing protein [Acidobacteriota bacterium]